MTYYFVGLGNPGAEYAGTRHNAGREVLEVLRRRQKWPEWHLDKKSNALISGGKLGPEVVKLILPETMMNRSGLSVAAFVKSAAARKGLVLIHDDLDLPLGRFKLSFDRSAGGHRGVASVIKALKSQAFARLRLGVEKKTRKTETIDFILSKFSPAEREALKKVFKKSAEALETVALAGLASAMTVYNQN
jgi:PTH1 family peptidyl-tRNA hydrolase